MLPVPDTCTCTPRSTKTTLLTLLLGMCTAGQPPRRCRHPSGMVDSLFLQSHVPLVRVCGEGGCTQGGMGPQEHGSWAPRNWSDLGTGHVDSKARGCLEMDLKLNGTEMPCEE